MFKEIWKNIPGYDGKYQVSNMGNARSINANNTGKVFLLKKYLNNQGYEMIKTHTKNHRVHRLVANAFIENTFLYKTVNHINGIKTDNRVENLEWCSLSENIRHSYEIGIRDNAKKMLSDRNRLAKRINGKICKNGFLNIYVK